MIFNTSLVDLINLLFISTGIGVLCLCFVQITQSIQLSQTVRRYFQAFLVLILVYISTHLARQIMNGLPGSGVRIALSAVTFAEMLAAGFMAYMISMLIMSYAKTEKRAKPIAIALIAMVALHAVILIIGVPTGLIYYFDASNVYHRGGGFILSNLAPLIMLFTDIVLLKHYRENIEAHIRKAFWIYLIVPIAAIVIQGLFFGVQFIIFASVGGAIYMFAVIVQDQYRKFETQKNERSRLEGELSTASGIQAEMLPSIFPAFPERPEFDIFASMDPAKEVGGDFYDFFLLDDDHLYVVIADVSGKGVPAALFMMGSMIVLANHAMMGKSPAQILTDANKAICANNRENMFVTVWLGILELSTGKLTAANAGHEYPAIQKPNGQFELFKDKHDMMVGMEDFVEYREYELQMEPGSRIFVYTDGVPEATAAPKGDAKPEMFGTDRMIDALNIDPNAPLEELLKNVRHSVDTFVGDAEQFDDLTMLSLLYRGH